MGKKEKRPRARARRLSNGKTEENNVHVQTTSRYVEKQQLFIVCPLRRLITKIILKSKNCFTKFCYKAEKVLASKLYRRFLNEIGWVNAQFVTDCERQQANEWSRKIG